MPTSSPFRPLIVALACAALAPAAPAAAAPPKAKHRAAAHCKRSTTARARRGAAKRCRADVRQRASRKVTRRPARPGGATLQGSTTAPATPAPSPPPGPPAPTPDRGPTTPSAPALPFAPDSVWNRALPANEPLDSNSAAYVTDLQSQRAGSLAWMNTSQYSSPVYTVGPDQPTVRVQLDDAPWGAALQTAWERVPIPAGARPAAGTDGTMVVWQPGTDTLWEFWQAVRLADGWHAHWGGRMTGVSHNPGYYTDPPDWGATASSLPMLGGLVRIDELRAGHIDHALAMAIPSPRAGIFSWPAQRTDGNSASADALPEGARLRVDPALDLDRLAMPPLTRMLAKAAQRYGIIVRDRAGAVAFYGEDPATTGADPYSDPGGFFDGRSPGQLLESFPWAHLQVLRTQLRS